jgi:DNA-binding transcriptional ArsR family regulator
MGAFLIPDSTSPAHRVLTAIRQYRREHGGSPSHSEIARRAGVYRQRVGGHLKRLREAGLLTYTRGAARSIALADPLANMSDVDLELACLARGWRVDKSQVPALPDAFPIDARVPDWGLPALDALKHIE